MRRRVHCLAECVVSTKSSGMLGLHVMSGAQEADGYVGGLPTLLPASIHSQFEAVAKIHGIYTPGHSSKLDIGQKWDINQQ